MVWIEYGEYRGCILYYSDTEPKLYYSPCIAGAAASHAALLYAIDLELGPEPPPEPPPPEPPEDPELPYYIETYRDIQIWYNPEYDFYRATISGVTTVYGETVEEVRAKIDEVLDGLEPPEDPLEGLFAQVVAAIKVWVQDNIISWVTQWGQVVNNWITNVVEEITNVYNYITEQITNVYNDLRTYVTNVFNTVNEYVTNVFNAYNEYITNVHNTFNEYVTNIIGVSEEILAERLVGLTTWVMDLFKTLDPQGILKDPLGYIKAAFDTLIAPWGEGIVKAFWEGFEEGLKEA